jgi:spermidine/putrescine transport system permease protein
VPVLWVAVAHVGPLIAMARISLMNVYPGPPGMRPAFSLGAYAAFWREAGYRLSLLHSLGLATATTFVTLILAYPIAYHVALRVAPARRGRRLVLLVAPFWTSEVLRMFALVLLLDNRGALNAILRCLGLTTAPVLLLYGSGAVLAGMVYSVFLSMLLPLYAALDRLPRHVTEAAALDGAGPWTRLWHITLPLTARGVAAGAVLTFLATLGVFAAPALLGGTGALVFATTISDLFGAASGRWPMGAAFGFILLVAGSAVAALLTLALGRVGPESG